MSATSALTRSFEALPMMNPMYSPITPYLLKKSMNSIHNPLGSGGGAGFSVNASLIFTSFSRIFTSS